MSQSKLLLRSIMDTNTGERWAARLKLSLRQVPGSL